jgi:uncharacterized membrane protein YkoI
MRLHFSPGGLAATLAAVMLVAIVSTANAWDRDERYRDEMRHAVQSGEIKSLTDILALVRGQLPGEVAGVEIERKQGRWLYEFRVVDGNGRLFEVYIDARDGTIDRIKEK